MSPKDTLVRMLKQLREDIAVLQQQGAGYYSCIPMTRRYNKLLGQARSLLGSDNGVITTFEELDETDPHDPADKMMVVQGIRIEIGQLISLLESLGDDKT